MSPPGGALCRAALLLGFLFCFVAEGAAAARRRASVMLNATSLKTTKTSSKDRSIFNHLVRAAVRASHKNSDRLHQSPRGRSWKTSPVVVVLRPALVCNCKYSISDICSLIIFKSDQDTTAAEAIHKEAHILFFTIILFL